LKGIYDQTLDFTIATFAGWEGFEKFIEPLKKFKEKYIEKAAKTYTMSTESNAFNVLNHGDFHIRNLLYKMKPEGGGVEDFVFVSLTMESAENLC
jgi:thiamine kinase-like enzyme